MEPAAFAAPRPNSAVSARRVLRLLALYALLWLACVQGALWFGDLGRWRLQLQSLAYPALLLLMLFSPPAHRLWRAVTPLARCAAALLLVLAVNGQLTLNNAITYPFSCWTMYTSKRPIPLLYHAVITVRIDGTRQRGDISAHVSGVRPFLSLLSGICDREQAALRDGDEAAAARHRAQLLTLLNELADRMAAPDLARVELVQINLADDGGVRSEKIRASSSPRIPEDSR